MSASMSVSPPPHPPGWRPPNAGRPGSRRRHPAARARRVTTALTGVAFTGLVGVMAANPIGSAVASTPTKTSTSSTTSSASSTQSSSSASATPATSSSSTTVTHSHAS